MAAPRHRTAGLAAAGLACAFLLAGTLALGGKQAAAPDASLTIRVLYPPDRCAVLSGALRVIVAAPKRLARLPARLDGKPLALQRMPFAATWLTPGAIRSTAEAVGDRAETAIWIAQPRLAPGRHTLAVVGPTLQFTVGKATPPVGWAAFHAHPALGGEPARPDCAACHDRTEGALGAARTPAACARCHDEAAVQSIHSHVPQPFARCAMCHDPHGASRPKMLVDDKHRLCSRCHEAGHAKP